MKVLFLAANIRVKKEEAVHLSDHDAVIESGAVTSIEPFSFYTDEGAVYDTRYSTVRVGGTYINASRPVDVVHREIFGTERLA